MVNEDVLTMTGTIMMMIITVITVVIKPGCPPETPKDLLVCLFVENIESWALSLVILFLQIWGPRNLPV